MNFTQLEYFVAICENGSVSRAAEKLFITQSALSQQLLRLENELHTELFHRCGNALILTDNGRIFLSTARDILFEYHNTLNRIADESQRNRLTIVVTKTKSFITLSYLLPGFLSRYPHIDVSIREVDSYQVEDLLLHGEGDLGFCYNSNDTKLEYHFISDESILLAIPPNHRLCAEPTCKNKLYPTVRFEEIAEESFIIGSSGYLRQYIQELFRERGRTLHVAMETANPGLLHLLVAANAGLAFVGEVSTWVAPVRIEQPRYFVLEGEEHHKMKIALAHHRRRHITPSMRLFIDYARQFMENQRHLSL